jgi:hypothetical protein
MNKGSVQHIEALTEWERRPSGSPGTRTENGVVIPEA